MKTWRVFLVSTWLLVAGCTTVNEFAPPALLTTAGTAPEPATLHHWWERFGDAQLNTYVEQALTHNRQIDAARAAVREASASRRAARSAFLPTVNAEGGYTWQEQSINSPAGAGPLIGAGIIDRDIEFWSAGLEGRWDLDLFSGTRRLNDVARARAEQSIAARDAVALGVVAETASALFELRGAVARRAIVERNIAVQSETLDIIEKRVAIGLSRALDALRARGQLETTRAALPTLEAAIRAATYRLSVLTNNPVSRMTSLPASLLADATLPALPATLPESVPAGFLRERPDVAAAERELMARAAELGVARAQFYPQLWLGASAGLESGSLSDLARGDSRIVGLAPRLSLPIFQGGRLRARRDVALARAERAYADLEQILLQSQADAHTALALVNAESATLRHATIAADVSAQAQDIARGLYDRGLGDFLSLLDAQREQLRAEDAALQSATRLRLQLVRLYTTLGGDARRLLASSQKVAQLGLHLAPP